MRITDCAYITSMRDIALQPALAALEAAMLPAKLPRSVGALAYMRAKEAQLWQCESFTCRRSGSGKRGPGR